VAPAFQDFQKGCQVSKQKRAFFILTLFSAIFFFNILCYAFPPLSIDDQYTTDEDTGLKVLPLGVLANDIDPDGDGMTAILETGPSNGTLTLTRSGSFNYAPNSNFKGTDSFTYRANDGSANSHVATVFITVQSVNDPPVANDGTYSIDQNTMLIVSAPGVLGNDSDVDGDALTAVLDNDVGSGTLALQPDGSFTYSPDIGFFGTDSYSYSACDDRGLCDTATAMITVLKAQPDINLNPTSLDFGTVIIRNGKILTRQVKNQGRDNLDVTNIYPCGGTSGEFTTSPRAPFTVAHGGSQTLTVTYTPVDEGADNGCLVIESNDPDQDSVELNLAGTGAKPVDLDVQSFNVTNKVKLSNIKPIKIELIVQNLSSVDGSARQATVVGVQNIFEVYSETMMVFDLVGGSGTKWSFPVYRPTNLGNIQWTVRVDDDDPDVDSATALTIINP
jgi:VCBS repeat-containing protein